MLQYSVLIDEIKVGDEIDGMIPDYGIRGTVLQVNTGLPITHMSSIFHMPGNRQAVAEVTYLAKSQGIINSKRTASFACDVIFIVLREEGVKLVNSRYPKDCRVCKSPSYWGMNTLECSNPGCIHYDGQG